MVVKRRGVRSSLRGKAGLRKEFWRLERERLRVQENAGDDNTVVAEPGGCKSTWGEEQGFGTLVVGNVNKETLGINEVLLRSTDGSVDST